VQALGVGVAGQRSACPARQQAFPGLHLGYGWFAFADIDVAFLEQGVAARHPDCRPPLAFLQGKNRIEVKSLAANYFLVGQKKIATIPVAAGYPYCPWQALTIWPPYK
jgi:hypothetical protein